MLAALRFSLTLERCANFDPAQPRDEIGRWTSIGTSPEGTEEVGPDGSILVAGPFDWGSVDLRFEEGYEGGHTIARHVGKTDEELAAMILADRRPSPQRFPKSGLRVGSFSSIAEANRLVNDTLLSDPSKVEAVRAGVFPSAVVRSAYPDFTGREAVQLEWNGELYARKVSGVKVLIIRDTMLLKGFRVHTAFPCLVDWERKMFVVPEYLYDAVSGFYQLAMEFDGKSVEDMIAIGIPTVRQSRCAELVTYIDDLLRTADDATIVKTWRASGADYFWDAADTREILAMIRDKAAERVASGGGGMPG